MSHTGLCGQLRAISEEAERKMLFGGLVLWLSVNFAAALAEALMTKRRARRARAASQAL